MKSNKKRCPWCGTDPLYVQYHDEEWGVPVHDERTLFEMLNLEGAQAGLSWLIILRKRENYRKAFARWNIQKIAKFDSKKVNALVLDAGIVRHRGKIEAVIDNARATLALKKEGISLDGFLWSFVGGKPIQHYPKKLKDLTNVSPESEAMSKALKKRGFRFVGSTTCYAFMQAVGMVNDHLVGCHYNRSVR